MNTALDELCDEVGGDDGARLRTAIHSLENEAGNNANARAFLAAVCWICEQPRSVTEKLTAMAELWSLPKGFVHIPSMAEFCGWRDA
jgi:hypothetical protein